MTPNGPVRCCIDCGLWLPQTPEHYYSRKRPDYNSPGGGWDVRCKACRRLRRRFMLGLDDADDGPRPKPPKMPPNPPPLDWATVLGIPKDGNDGRV